MLVILINKENGNKTTQFQSLFTEAEFNEVKKKGFDTWIKERVSSAIFCLPCDL